MTKKKYQNILISYLTDYAKIKPVNLPDVDRQVITDVIHNHFQLTYIGWQGDQFIFSTIFHFDIKDEKIWIQCNNTERVINEELIKLGVAKEDIVLGFQPPYVRALLEQVTI